MCIGDSGSALWEVVKDENDPCTSKGKSKKGPQEPSTSKEDPNKNPQPSTSKGEPCKRPSSTSNNPNNPKKPKLIEKHTVMAVSTAYNVPCGYKGGFATKIDNTVLEWINENKEGYVDIDIDLDI